MTTFRGCLLLFFALASGLPAASADEKGAAVLAAAIQFLHEVPAYQIRRTTTYPETGWQVVDTTEGNASGLVHFDCSLGDKRLDRITDGEREFENKDGRIVETERARAWSKINIEMMYNMVSGSGHLQQVTKQAAGNVTLLQHETVGGEPAVLVFLVAQEPFRPHTIKLWIANADQRPLKMEEEWSAYDKYPPQYIETVFEYNPSIVVRFPDAVAP